MVATFVRMLPLVAIIWAASCSPPAIAQNVVVYSEATDEQTIQTPAVDHGCPDGIEDRSSDLCAQWKAADAAVDSAVWSARSFYLSLVGGVVGAATLAAAVAAAFFARDAAREAKRSADAGAEAVVAARDLGEAQIRAYLYLKTARYERHKDRFSVILDIGNSGQSPANQVRIASELYIYQIGGMPNHTRVLTYVSSDKQYDKAQPVNSNGAVEETVTFHWGFGIPSQSEDRNSDHLKYVFREGNSVQVEVEIQWIDVFGSSHKFQAGMDAEVGPTPTNNRKNYAHKGPLDIRTNDTLHRVAADPGDN